MRLLLVEDEKRMAEALCKACGMLLARKIIHTELPEYRSYFEPHDSFYIGSAYSVSIRLPYFRKI